MVEERKPLILFSDYFDVPQSTLDDYGAFNVSLISDLPLFIDPFLLFNSKDAKYRKLHEGIVNYLTFLYDKSTSSILSKDDREAWFHFKEVKQTWLGFTVSGNSGRGLSTTFANSLISNLPSLLKPRTEIPITKSYHLEKLCLIENGVGRDRISDFATNLIKEYLLEYTQEFAKTYLKKEQCKELSISRVKFNPETESWMPESYYLPYHKNLLNYKERNSRGATFDRYVILTPRNLLARHKIWINRDDLVSSVEGLAESISDNALRAHMNSYLQKAIRRNMDRKEEEKAKKKAINSLLNAFPEIIDYYIKSKEENGDEAESTNSNNIFKSEILFLDQFTQLAKLMSSAENFSILRIDNFEESIKRVEIIKEEIERDGKRFLYSKSHSPVSNEDDLRVAFRFLWFNNINKNEDALPDEADVIPVGFKLASNSRISDYLQKINQRIEDKKSTGAKKYGITVLFAFSEYDRANASAYIKDFSTDSHYITVIDATASNEEKFKMTNSRDRTQIFISYCHKDAAFLADFKTHFKPYIREKSLSIWSDTQIKASHRWREEIKKALSSAGVALLLVSPDFLASDFIADNELPEILRAAKEEGLSIFWVPLRPSAYQTSFVEEIQSIPSPHSPLSSMPKPKREQAMVDICKSMADHIQSKP